MSRWTTPAPWAAPSPDATCPRQGDGLRFRQGSVLSDVRLQGWPGQQFHDQKRRVPVGTAVKDRHDVGMLQRRRSSGLPDEPFERSPVTLRIELLHLDRHVPAEHRVMRRPDLTHPARSDPPVQPIPPGEQGLRVHARHPTLRLRLT